MIHKYKLRLLALLLAAGMPAAVGAQGVASAPDDTITAGAAAVVLRRAQSDLDREDYAGALGIVTEYLSVKELSRQARTDLLRLAAFAAWPSAQTTSAGPDSAKSLLRALIRIEPEARLRRDATWPGLDSLLEVARASTLGAAVRWNSRYELVGTYAPATFKVVSTRPVKAWLSLQRQGIGDSRVIDSVSGPTGGTLRLFAHDGQEAIISEGSWLLRVTVVDSATRDTLLLPAAEVVAEGSPPSLMPSDVALDTTLLRPEWHPPARVTGVAAGVLMAAASIGIASAARAPAIRRSVGVDGRAVTVGVIGGVASVVAGWFDRGRPIPENIARNRALRDEYAYRARFITKFNETNVNNYRVRLVLREELRPW